MVSGKLTHDAVEDERGDYVPKCILVTGGAGFIASHVVIRLMKSFPDYKIVVLDKLDYCASLQNLSSVEGMPNFKFVKGDIKSSDLVNYVLRAEAIDTVMHFAAQTHVDHSFGNSLSFTINNTYGTHVLLECCRVAGTVRRFINVSTDEVYGESSLGKDQAIWTQQVSEVLAWLLNQNIGRITYTVLGFLGVGKGFDLLSAPKAFSCGAKGLGEHSSLEPTNPYSAAKAGAEMMCKAYMNSFNMPIIVTRGNNVYGPHQFPEKLVPKFTLLASLGRELPIHGHGQNVRSYLYVEDVAEAYEIILHKGVTGETYNVGTQIERSVLDVCEDIRKHFLLAESKVQHVKDRAFNDRRYFIGCDKIAALGWRQRTSWEEGLKMTIDWYLEHGFEYWDAANVEAALKPHPILFPSNPGEFSSESIK